MSEITNLVPGAAELVDWFGQWPSFHDAEVLDLELHRAGNSILRVYTFETGDEVAPDGSFVRSRHAVVRFVLDGVTDLHLDSFNRQNVISGLQLQQKGGGYELTLNGCYGVEGSLSAQKVRIEVHPGMPTDGSP